jgi:uncharacterized membrane protein
VEREIDPGPLTWFGFVAYATYDLTKLATLREWPVWLAVMDMGGALY